MLHRRKCEPLNSHFNIIKKKGFFFFFNEKKYFLFDWLTNTRV